ncbi:transcription factor IBH1 [Trifolium repens]|nr:transcription factor IBH1 [Trifolium repens]
MRNLSSLKKEFLRKWIKGLRKYNSQKKNMTLLERKKAIKLSADLAMASTKDKTTLWRKALFANTSTNIDNEQDISTTSSPQKVIRKNSTNSYPLRKRITGRRKILRRNRTKERMEASFIAMRLVKKRTRRLKSLLPGGKFMDNACLVDETLDYIESLKAQVEVMRCLVTSSELFINPS